MSSIDNKAPDLVNRVAQSGLITLNLKDYLPTQAIVPFDLTPFLYMGMVLKEKEYREALKNHDWTPYAHTIAAVHCSADAIVPVWAFMLATVYLQQAGAKVAYGTVDAVKQELLINNVLAADTHTFAGGRVIIKGCADADITTAAYIAIAHKLTPVVKSLMYGEACSNVPLYKQKPATAEKETEQE